MRNRDCLQRAVIKRRLSDNRGLTPQAPPAPALAHCKPAHDVHPKCSGGSRPCFRRSEAPASRRQVALLFVEIGSFRCKKALVCFELSYRDGSAESPLGRTGSAHAVGRHHQPSAGVIFFCLSAFLTARAWRAACASAHRRLFVSCRRKIGCYQRPDACLGSVLNCDTLKTRR